MLATLAVAASESPITPTGVASLGLDGRVFVFQIINFALLLFVLYKVAYRPVLKVLDQRRAKIEHSLKSAEAIENERRVVATEQQKILSEAHKKAEAILAESGRQAKTILAQAESQAQARSQNMTTEAEARIEQSLREAKEALRKDTLHVITQATETILHEKLTQEKDEQFIRTTLDRLQASPAPKSSP